ncbi:hypothetical protein PCANC_22854 [Puccinia coronata f. sp. avenae]|uniref:Uncharacterized protein n=1 Tax=Puccinia coronata f. sp. avenae TaxID=200324 RepID=A0A2N5TRL9_9BASI|nr:hypothetical protein PCASD_23247 [Puccinia coronata f. sp. avenae]PLW33531.1 hypothetical protein PCANC_22854 [Puccinia coronata f. sp. avenae]
MPQWGNGSHMCTLTKESESTAYLIDLNGQQWGNGSHMCVLTQGQQWGNGSHIFFPLPRPFACRPLPDTGGG